VTNALTQIKKTKELKWKSSRKVKGKEESEINMNFTYHASNAS